MTANNEWQPVERAPKDGTSILCYADECYGKVMVVCEYKPSPDKDRNPWLESDGEYYHRYNVTHWQPLPNPPKEQS